MDKKNIFNYENVCDLIAKNFPEFDLSQPQFKVSDKYHVVKIKVKYHDKDGNLIEKINKPFELNLKSNDKYKFLFNKLRGHKVGDEIVLYETLFKIFGIKKQEKLTKGFFKDKYQVVKPPKTGPPLEL
jgi:hypothetical protein